MCTFPIRAIRWFVLRPGSMGQCTITTERVAGVIWIGFILNVLFVSCVKSLKLSLDVIHAPKQAPKSSYGSNA